MRNFGRTAEGEQAHLYEIRKGRLRAELTDYGAVLVSYAIADDTGKETDVVLGLDSVADYERDSACFGATIGRNANRVAGASFLLNGRWVQLEKNEGENNLHSGPNGYHRRLWKTDGVNSAGDAVVFTLNSPDGDQGFPGNLKVQVTYQLSEKDGLSIFYRAVSDEDTVCNLTNHSYFNLNGHDSGDVLDQELQIFSSQITPVGADSIPDGSRMDVSGTPFDFRVMKKIGAEISAEDVQLAFTGGYDHNYILAEKKDKVRRAAEAYSYETGICLEMDTDLPGMQFYTGNFIGEQSGKKGAFYGPRSGFALEGQFFPNSVNEPLFPQPVLRAGETYAALIRYRLYFR